MLSLWENSQSWYHLHTQSISEEISWNQPTKKFLWGQFSGPAFWALFSISIGVGGFQSKQFPLRNQIWEAFMPPPAPNPLFLFPQEKMHGIRMQSKGKGKKGDCSIGDMLDYTACLVLTPALPWWNKSDSLPRTLLELWALSAPTVLWSWSHQPGWTREPGQPQLGEHPNSSPWGWRVVYSGDDTRLGLSYEYVL